MASLSIWRCRSEATVESVRVHAAGALGGIARARQNRCRWPATQRPAAGIRASCLCFVLRAVQTQSQPQSRQKWKAARRVHISNHRNQPSTLDDRLEQNGGLASGVRRLRNSGGLGFWDQPGPVSVPAWWLVPSIRWELESQSREGLDGRDIHIDLEHVFPRLESFLALCGDQGVLRCDEDGGDLLSSGQSRGQVDGSGQSRFGKNSDDFNGSPFCQLHQ